MSANCLVPVRRVSGYAGWMVAILVIITAVTLRAQSPTISIGGGYERGQARVEFTRADSNRYNDVFEDGIDEIGVFGEVSIPICTSVTMAARISGHSSNVAFSAPIMNVQVLIPGEDSLIFDKVQEEITFSIRTIRLELLGRMEVAEGLRVAAGPTIGYRVIQGYQHSEYHTVPLWGTYWGVNGFIWPRQRLPRVEENGHRIVFDDDSNLQQNHVAIGALVNVEYELPLSRRLSLVPELQLRGDFTSPFPDTNWNLLCAGGAISVRFSL